MFLDIINDIRECVGFRDAPDINNKKNMSRLTILPIAIPLKPSKHFVYTNTRITIISKAGFNNSTPKMR